MSEYREILTKAIVAKGYKEIKEEKQLTIQENISRTLGCWVINHKHSVIQEKNKIFINGSYQVFIWYGFDDDTNCKLESQEYTFKDEIPYEFNDKNDVLSNDNELKHFVSKQPTCIELKQEDKTIFFTIHRTYNVDIIGETKLTIKVSQSKKDELDDLTSKINTDYISDKK